MPSFCQLPCLWGTSYKRFQTELGEIYVCLDAQDMFAQRDYHRAVVSSKVWRGLIFIAHANSKSNSYSNSDPACHRANSDHGRVRDQAADTLVDDLRE